MNIDKELGESQRTLMYILQKMIAFPVDNGGIIKLTARKSEVLNRLMDCMSERSEFTIHPMKEQRFQVNFIQPRSFWSFLRFKKDIISGLLSDQYPNNQRVNRLFERPA